MGNEFFKNDERRAANVNRLFARIAHRYDLINDLQSFGLHRHWKHQVVCWAKLAPGMEALDVCCGTGDLAMRMATTGANVTGLDFTAEMIAIARKRCQHWSGRRESSPELNPRAPGKPGHAPARTDFCYPQFVEGDAQQLPFSDNTFDAVTVGYGLRNLADWERGLREMVRVAKLGGRIVVLDFGKPENPIWRALYFGYLRVFVPLLGLTFCGSASAYAYILHSLKHYPAQHGVAAKMRELGLKNVGLRRILGATMTINFGEKG